VVLIAAPIVQEVVLVDVLEDALVDVVPLVLEHVYLAQQLDNKKILLYN
jgi:hypothetical protein